jgi:sulfonate transport system permease protein
MPETATTTISSVEIRRSASSRTGSTRTILAWRRGLTLPVLIAVGYLIFVDGGLVTHPLLVPLHRIIAVPFVDPDGRELFGAIAVSLGRVVAGSLIGSTLGVSAALVLGFSRDASAAVAPTIHTVRQIALFAWIPLLTAWFGNGEATKIVFVALSAFFPTFLNTEQGLRVIPRSYREVARVLRLPLRRRLFALMLPAALPAILIGIEIALISGWIGTVGAEYAIGSGRGLGSFLSAARDQFRMDMVLVGVLALAVIGYAINAGVNAAVATHLKGRKNS